MAYTKIWIHCVWGTKKRIPFIGENKWEILDHIKENAKQKNIFLDYINGSKDHIHCLISLKADQTISKVVQLIKGESSFWINKKKITNHKFEWAEEYFAVSVSESQLNKVREYIKNQDKHHLKKTFQEEYNEFVTKYKFEKLEAKA